MILTSCKPLLLLLLPFALLLIISQARSSQGQATDGDEHFQAYHQDISRISGAPSQAQVAPQTVVRQVTAATSATQAPVERLAIQPTARPRFQPSNNNNHHHNHHHRHQQAQSSRRPSSSRITLAVRTSAPALPSVAAGEELRAPELAAASLQQQVARAEPLFSQLPASPGSFRAASPAPAGSSTVSARHSALMAQVAAERQVAEAISGQAQLAPPSLGSPLEALSSPAGLQVQAPPTLVQQQQPQAAPASVQPSFVNQPEEPLVAPSFEHVLSQGCPQKGVFSYENKDYCDRYYMCTNGTFTEEACPNGLAYSQMGAVYQHCAYNWNVDCANKKTAEPLASPGCPWQFGIFPVTQGAQGANPRCSIDYFVCEWGVPETKRCQPEGLFYDDRIKGCQWADQLGCKSEALLNFKCPQEDEDNPYWPYPRYYHTKQDVIVCVNEQPRLVHCTEEQLVDPSSLACLDLKKNKKKKPGNF